VIKFVEFDATKGRRQKLPPERKEVIVCLAPFRKGLPNMLMVGYLRYAAGDKDSPQFILPGVPQWATVLGWCDCLTEDVIQMGYAFGSHHQVTIF